jgi:hypothetical protein
MNLLVVAASMDVSLLHDVDGSSYKIDLSLIHLSDPCTQVSMGPSTKLRY